ncbi:hypothetical protein MmiAt1_12300 [Methanimicrococcus sp. At1]|uniref:Uncharacterized protein n=1 Tax=Methanimicrococcus hacksteinii TaxID=3028293 RepID=A0ABU3VR56_9EURY|nr:hypothetical protein [Methanimicrococcus sp. At1]MDV0445641.1 hypothetical protein [Methanimicrococcus sp. At1]
MKRNKISRILTIAGIACLMFVLMAGISTADPVPSGFNLADGDIIITVIDDTNVSLAHSSGQSDMVPTHKTINIYQTDSDTATTSNTISYNGDYTRVKLKLQINALNISNETLPAISLKNGANVNLILEGDNYLTGGTANDAGQAGLEVPEGCEITISSLSTEISNKGKLTAKGGGGHGGGGSGAAVGSGGGSDGSSGGSVGTITIKDNCVIEATGGGGSEGGGGAAIGSGGGGTGISCSGGSVGTITIEDNCVIKAIGGDSIGGGGGGGAAVGSGGGGRGSDGGFVENILINTDCDITATGGGGGGGGGGSAIGSGGGGDVYTDDEFIHHVGNGGSVTGTIQISGEKTDIIAVSGGIGRGAPGVGIDNDDEKAKVIIESGNVLILDQPETAMAEFKNEAGGEIYPISFTVMDNNNDENKLENVLVTAGAYKAETRADAKSRVGSSSDYYETGTVTMWLPSDGTTETSFSFDYNGDVTTYEHLVSTPRIDTIGNSFIPIYMTEITSKSNGGGSGFGSAKVVTAETETVKTDSKTEDGFGGVSTQDSGKTGSTDKTDLTDNTVDSENNGSENKTEKSGNQWIWIAVGGFLILVIAGVVGYVFLIKPKN